MESVRKGTGKLRDRSGFTLIEIMVVIVILGLLAALVVPKLIGRTEEAKKTQARVQIRNIEQALGLYKLDNGYFPSTEQGIAALIRSPGGHGDYDISSYGADGAQGGEGEDADVNSWDEQ